MALNITKALFKPSVISYQRTSLINKSWNSFTARSFATGPSEREKRIEGILKKGLSTENVEVIDTSGGCGAMYKIEVSSKIFSGKSLVQQHKMVNDLLSEEMKTMHGLTLKTKAEN